MWPEQMWAIQLVPLLEGRARAAYVAMDAEEALDYGKLKTASLRKSDIDKETYRQKFQSDEVCSDETPRELFVRLKGLYEKWMTPKEKTKEQIGDTIILEQYLKMINPELRSWILERNLATMDLAVDLVEAYTTARRAEGSFQLGKAAERHQHRQPGESGVVRCRSKHQDELLTLDHLTTEQREELRKIIPEGSFSEEPGRTTAIQHDIRLQTQDPIRQLKCRVPARLIPKFKEDTFDPYPMPRADELIESLSTEDLCKGYWQVPLTESAKELTAFRAPNGLFYFVIMPFGLHGAAATLQRLMDTVLKGTEDFAASYLDDIVIYSGRWKEHLHHLETVLGKIRAAVLTANPGKCHLAKGVVSYLGYVLGGGAIRPQLEKVQAVKECPIPNHKEVISGSPDFSKPFVVQTDASGNGLGAVLLQGEEDSRRPILYISRKLFPRDKNYSTVEKEALAVKWALDSLKYHLMGKIATLTYCSERYPDNSVATEHPFTCKLYTAILISLNNRAWFSWLACISAFNTIQPLLLRDKLMKMEVDMHLVTWITDYLTGRPQHVRIRDCSSDTVISSTGAPQGTVLSPVLFTLYTSDFKYNSELCHMQKFSDDTAIVGCVCNGQEREYRSLVEDFVEWCTTNHLKLNITKTKEMCIDFRRSRPSQQPISIKGVDVEVVRSYRYLGVHLDERLDWSVNTDMVYKKAQSRLYFLRRLGSFRICQKLLLMFYQSVVASVLFYAVVCWGGSISKRDAGRLDRLVRKAGSVLGLELESLTPLAERRALSKLLHIMDNVHHPLHSTIIRQRSSFSVHYLETPVHYLEIPVHYLETPVHYLETLVHYLETLVHYLETPVHYLETPVPYLETPVPYLETPVHYLEIPVHYLEIPVHYIKTPVHYLEIPVNYLEIPVNYLETPVHYLETPVHYLEIPVHYLEIPVHYLETPVHYLETLVHYLETLVHYLETPVHYLETPVPSLETPVPYLETPVHYLEIPVHYLEIPVHYIKTPVHYLEIPVNYLEIPVNYLETPVHYLKTPVHYPETPVHYLETPVHYLEIPVHYLEIPVHYLETLVGRGWPILGLVVRHGGFKPDVGSYWKPVKGVQQGDKTCFFVIGLPI
ncbi:hypothetical protein NFI96_000961 [Prochilodus magdalenae]|nr:hypothetical protein NFI96_000961 [Prochilodus magdalenae]